MGSSTEGLSGDVRMCPPRSVQRFVAPWGAQSKAQVTTFACTRPHSTALRGPMRSSTEGLIGDVRMCPPRPAQHFVGRWGAPPKAPIATFAC
eukprot:331178-Pyramimonas_sp.AAC.1